MSCTGSKRAAGCLSTAPTGRSLPGYTTFNVDLTGIALKEKLVVAGSPILNTPVLGALAKMGIVSVDSAKTAIREMFTDERNVKAAEATYVEMSA